MNSSLPYEAAKKRGRQQKKVADRKAKQKKPSVRWGGRDPQYPTERVAIREFEDVRYFGRPCYRWQRRGNKVRFWRLGFHQGVELWKEIPVPTLPEFLRMMEGHFPSGASNALTLEEYKKL